MSTSVHRAVSRLRQPPATRPRAGAAGPGVVSPVAQPATMPKPKPKPGAPGKPGQPGKPRPKPGPKKFCVAAGGRHGRTPR